MVGMKEVYHEIGREILEKSNYFADKWFLLCFILVALNIFLGQLNKNQVYRIDYYVMNFFFLLKGIIIGFSIAAPVGPIGILCIRRTLAEGQIIGFISGLGAATADALYGCVAAFSLTFISNFLVSQQVWFRLIGGMFLCYLGVKTFLSQPSEKPASASHIGLLSSYGSTFFLTLTNPMTILSFAAIFAGLGLANTGGDYPSAGLTVLGVFIGSACWWLILSGSISLFRTQLQLSGLRWVNRISAVIITIFGIIALFGILFS
jgi:threonine/homoserine/homoserine lactone efflux protein